MPDPLCPNCLGAHVILGPGDVQYPCEYCRPAQAHLVIYALAGAVTDPEKWAMAAQRIRELVEEAAKEL